VPQDQHCAKHTDHNGEKLKRRLQEIAVALPRQCVGDVREHQRQDQIGEQAIEDHRFENRNAVDDRVEEDDEAWDCQSGGGHCEGLFRNGKDRALRASAECHEQCGQ